MAPLFYFLFLLAAVSSQAAVIEVHRDLALAIARARPGDELLVFGPQVYRGNLVIEKSLRLLGTNGPVLDGDGQGSPVTVKAPHVELQGLIVRDGGHDLSREDAGMMIRAADVQVRGCRVEGGGFGIYLRGVRGCVVQGNRIVGNQALPSAQRGNGIHLWKSSRNRLIGNTILHTRDGAYFSYADDNLIVSNRIEGTRFGIHYMFSNRNRLLDNVFTDNVAGAALMFARDCYVEGNRAVGNRRYGILLKQVEQSTVCGNTLSGQNRGLFIQGGVHDRFEENVIGNNDIGLYLSNGSEQCVFVKNVFWRNADQVWQPNDQTVSDWGKTLRFAEHGRGNYWSDYTGVDADGDGIGDTPYHETDWFGYVVDRHPEARLLALSPAVTLLRKGEALLPVLLGAGVTDPDPLMRVSRGAPSWPNMNW